jgi:hypothetical protein
MKVVILSSVVVLTTLSLGSVSYACDMHGGGGFGSFGMGNAAWRAYNPKASTFDPAYGYESEDFSTPIDRINDVKEKAKPSFSNVANIAALRAKARLAKKSESATAKADESVKVEKVSLNADR